MALTLVVALFAACSKQDKQALKKRRITAALNPTNPKRLAIAGKVLPAAPAGYELKRSGSHQ